MDTHGTATGGNMRDPARFTTHVSTFIGKGEILFFQNHFHFFKSALFLFCRCVLCSSFLVLSRDSAMEEHAVTDTWTIQYHPNQAITDYRDLELFDTPTRDDSITAMGSHLSKAIQSQKGKPKYRLAGGIPFQIV